MKSIKRLMGIMLWALVVILGTTQAFANGGTGEMMGITYQGPSETPGLLAVLIDYLALIF